MEKTKKGNFRNSKGLSHLKKTSTNFSSTKKGTFKKEDLNEYKKTKENEQEKKIREQNQKDKEQHLNNENEIKDLDLAFSNLEKEYEEIKNKNTELNKQITLYSNDINIKNKLISTKKTNLKALKEKNLKLEKQLMDLKKELEEQLNQNENEEENRPISINQLFQNVLFRMGNNPGNFFLNLNNHQEENDNNNDRGLSSEQLLNLPNSKYSKFDNNSEKCDICGFVFCYNDTISKLDTCRHIFHRECLFNFLQDKSSSKCPTCKINIF